MLSDELIEELIEQYMIEVYQELEKDVLQDIARRVAKTGRFTETAELMAQSMREQGFSAAQIHAEVMKILQADKEYMNMIAQETKAYKAMVTKAISDTEKNAKALGNKFMAEAGDMAFNADMSMWEAAGLDLKANPKVSQIVNSFTKDLNGQLRNLTRTTGFKNTALGTTGVMNAYQRALDKALLEISSGAFSFDEACNKVVEQMAASGLRSIDYAGGRSYQLDTATRMCARTSVNKMAAHITQSNCENMDQDLVIISQHEGARDEHAEVENKIFSLSGRSSKYPAISAPLPSDGGDGAGYGDPGGICGINCRHTFYPWFEGISEKPERIDPWDDKEVDGKEYTYYDATQRQRAMEREIRALKREKYVASTTEAQRALQRRISAKVDEYNAFSDRVGIRPKPNRLRVVGA